MNNDSKEDKIGNRTYKALECLYLNSKDRQNVTEKSQYPLYQLAHAKEFCTIKLATARCSGHTTAIAKFLSKHTNEKWAVISWNQRMGERLSNLISNFFKDPKSTILEQITEQITEHSRNPILGQTTNSIKYKKGGVHFMSLHTFDKYLRGLELDGIIVDCAFLWSQSKIEELYNVGMPCMQKQHHMYFIFVQ